MTRKAVLLALSCLFVVAGTASSVVPSTYRAATYDYTSVFFTYEETARSTEKQGEAPPIRDSYFPIPSHVPAMPRSVPDLPSSVPVVIELGEPNPSSMNSVSDAKAWALAKVGPAEYLCLDELYKRESNWRTRARNSSSGAYGIPQALPGSKMAWAGDDWRTNPVTQVRWGVHYIKGRYGSPCKAWSFFLGHGWY